MPKLRKKEIKGVKFYYREGFSDLKTFDEVIGRDVYQKKGFKINPGESWMDCGGNVGAFTLLAASLGAKVTVYEPDPYNCQLIEKNLKLNGFKATIKQAALVHDQTEKSKLFIGSNNNVWRNSLVKQWSSKKSLEVPCLNFDEQAKKFNCCKMDIEGMEMPILENTKKVFDKMVFEWSFDIDSSLRRFWAIADKLKQQYQQVNFPESTTKYKARDYDTWQKSWFPPCINVYCLK